ncbi:nucleoside triphosphate pyrophosphohydrolase [Kitasatospora atroaurantiaca]|uniref:XTP/dITP diphosphohydrolase n=1 Tax=Kitasatospora atroaurantiaca TaxID=285545 RepID=A0A561EUC2_9ACTN|nr:MazG family protein [Kitasatospora atroaurantiaca]TWE19208.1 XTP/dITP diphosphohydrolase [Kitasatospora atroaurantiaca]
MDTPKLILLTTTHRVAPGLLSWPAWEALRGAARVLAADPAHPQLPAVRQAGVEVELVERGTAPALARRLLEAAPARAPYGSGRAGAESDERQATDEGGSAGARSVGAGYERPEASGRVTVWLGSPDGDPGLTDALARLAVEEAGQVPEIEVLPGSYDLPGARLLDLASVMDRLRSPGGCPWDAEQTHASLVKYLVEEAFELVEAIEEGDRETLREELGDVLLQVFFHSRIAEEHPEDPFSIDDVAGDIVEKLMYRHPHVFGDVEATESAEVEANWEQLKAAEKQRESVLDGVPAGLPALAYAAKLVSRVRRAGFTGVPDAPYELPAELTPESVGTLLLAVAQRAHDADVDVDAALRAAARGYRSAVRAAEGLDAGLGEG